MGNKVTYIKDFSKYKGVHLTLEEKLEVELKENDKLYKGKLDLNNIKDSKGNKTELKLPRILFDFTNSRYKQLFNSLKHSLEKENIKLTKYEKDYILNIEFIYENHMYSTKIYCIFTPIIKYEIITKIKGKSDYDFWNYYILHDCFI